MSRLGSAAQRDLLELAPPRKVPPGTVLIRQGEVRNHVFVLRSKGNTASACVKITALARNGTETLLGIRVSGDIVGELAALRGAQRSATVTTCSETIVHHIPNQFFLDFLNEHSEAWEAMCRMIADRLDWANRRRLDFAGYDVTQRLARVLLELTDRYGSAGPAAREIGVRLSQAEMGMLIGAKEDAIGLAMRQLRRNGMVSTSYRKVTIMDIDELRHFAD
ncbi:putative transcriptional regulator [Nocardia nova SH22a]|uniref:Putative transcriptional regulator n=1 Tax=Nocardia nova SH22a TaxID=1415166 RepID=W5TT05_9NOCA|nr:Crp/Fnr family transcriptional regulator [Nocardia nova]AHH22334.1 putative transcriptional regulator [Nocardia nova SH22a]